MRVRAAVQVRMLVHKGTSRPQQDQLLWNRMMSEDLAPHRRICLRCKAGFSCGDSVHSFLSEHIGFSREISFRVRHGKPGLGRYQPSLS